MKGIFSQLLTPRPPLHIQVTPVKGVTFTMWDVGGQEKVRALWRHYYEGTEGLVFVVDSSDVTRVQEARQELFNILTDEGEDVFYTRNR